ncbi:nuclear transport factor 2 family protein [Streptomyces sp. NBC_01618]|uniref:nuclear transport factor 2 family protein n=1 Tax=Streptomyces sp. NBC_01618 TaxID=2975900 RepID=UPI003865D26F|nr:nuclear transport factor 2 family protein [Streptomyces sp. NBC_01618]
MTHAEVHWEIQTLYAHQMRLYDDGAYEKWAATFTPDATFEIDLLPGPLAGRRAIGEAALHIRDRLDREDVQHRTWIGMLTVEPRHDGTVCARSYALVLAIPRGGKPELRHTAVCEDLLVRDGAGGWLVHDRQVVRDAVG